MKITPEQIQAVIDWRHRTLKHKTPRLEEIQGILGLGRGRIAGDDYELDGHFAFPPNLKDFDPIDIEEDITLERYNMLCESDSPSDEELKLWAEKKASLVFEEDGRWSHFYLWKVDLPEETIYFRSLHGDGGILDEFHGPYDSEKHALEDAGSLEINPR